MLCRMLKTKTTVVPTSDIVNGEWWSLHKLKLFSKSNFPLDSEGIWCLFIFVLIPLFDGTSYYRVYHLRFVCVCVRAMFLILKRYHVGILFAWFYWCLLFAVCAGGRKKYIKWGKKKHFIQTTCNCQVSEKFFDQLPWWWLDNKRCQSLSIFVYQWNAKDWNSMNYFLFFTCVYFPFGWFNIIVLS